MLRGTARGPTISRVLVHNVNKNVHTQVIVDQTKRTYGQLVSASTGAMIRVGHECYPLPHVFSTYINANKQQKKKRAIPFAACNCLSTEQENSSLPRNRILNRSSGGRLIKLRCRGLDHAVRMSSFERHRVQSRVVISVQGLWLCCQRARSRHRRNALLLPRDVTSHQTRSRVAHPL